MSKYLKHIIRYFFSHDVPEDLADRAQRRIARAKDTPASEEIFKEIWDKTNDCNLPNEEIEEAYAKVSSSLFGKEIHLWPQGWLRIAATWVLPVLMLATSFYFYETARQRSRQLASVTFVQRFTANGERELVVLPDNSKVWLNGGSLLIYPSQFISKERNVSLSGEAYFDVTKDASHPFVVNMNQSKLTVLGTTFNVSSYPDSDETTATLETGRIQINIDGQAKDYFLLPNDQLVYNSATGRVNISQVNSDDYSAWRTGALYFNDTPFDEAIRRLERAYNVRIHVLNSNYKDHTIRAHFSPNYSADQVMDIIKILIPSLNYEIHEKDIFIK